MGCGTCLNKQWWHQLKATTLAIYSQGKDAGVPSYNIAVDHLCHTHNAALKMRSNNIQHRMLTRNVQSLTKWVWEPLSIKNEGIESKQ